MKKVLVGVFALALALCASARDCVPYTFTTLSYLISKPVPSNFWLQTFFPNNEQAAPTVNKSVEIWNKMFAETQLVVVYTSEYTKSPELLDSAKVSFGVPYFWVGLPNEETQTANKTNEVHAAIIYFFPTVVIIVNTVDILPYKDTELFHFYTETLPYDKFFARTIFVFGLATKNPINLKPFTRLMIPELGNNPSF